MNKRARIFLFVSLLFCYLALASSAMRKKDQLPNLPVKMPLNESQGIMVSVNTRG